MNREVREKLIEYARIGRTITYGQLNEQLQLGYDFHGTPSHRSDIGDELGEISEFEHNKERPLLSALVVRSGSGYEGDGFYEICEHLGYGSRDSLKKNRKKFDEEQKQRCYDFWQDDSKYRKYLRNVSS